MSNIFATAVSSICIWNKASWIGMQIRAVPLGWQRMQTFRKFDRLSHNIRRMYIFCEYSRCVISCCEDIYTDLHAKYPSMVLLDPSVTVDFQHALASAIGRNGSGSSFLLPKQFLSVFFYSVVRQHLLERTEKPEMCSRIWARRVKLMRNSFQRKWDEKMKGDTKALG